MKNVLLASTLLLALGAPAYAQVTTTDSISNQRNSGVTVPDPGRPMGSVTNGQNSGMVSPAPGTTYRSIPNKQNSGMDMPAGRRVGTGMSGPASDRASNIAGGTMGSTVAPHFPAPSVAADASPQQLLAAAQQAIRQRRTGVAQEALERAETRLLDGSVMPGMMGPSADPMVKQVSAARMALGRGDSAGANQMISEALASH